MSERRGAAEGGGKRPDGEGDAGAEAIYAFADRLQQGVEREEEREELETWVCFAVGERELALPVGAVREIVRVGKVTRVPHSPEAVRGAFGYRDRAVPLLDLGLCLGGDRIEAGDAARIVVVASRGRLIGLLTDRALRVVSLAPSTFTPPAGGLAPRLAAACRAVAPHDGGTIALLDLERILTIDAFNESTDDEES